MNKYAKFAALIAIVVGAVVWLAVQGMGSNQTYYKTISELGDMKDQAYGKRLRVGGDVQQGSIQHIGAETRFVIIQDKLKLNVVYAGIDPLPDTFRDGAQALADGRLEKDGVFRAAKIQAKCASKYEAKPGQTGGVPPNVNTGKSAI
jgi:cytochrome c-type biogenesis protein CcmE